MTSGSGNERGGIAAAPGADVSSENRLQLRREQLRLLDRNTQSELLISILVACIGALLFRDLIAIQWLLCWIVAIITSIGLRSLAIHRNTIVKSDGALHAWGEGYTATCLASGFLWGCLGVIAYHYGSDTLNLITLILLSCVALTTYSAAGTTPLTTAAFVIPAFLPGTFWLLFSDRQVFQLVGIVTITMEVVMIVSSRGMQNVLTRSVTLGAYNTGLIRKLVVERDKTTGAMNDIERINFQLQEEIRRRQDAETKIAASQHRLAAILNGMQDTIYQTDATGKIIWTTPSVQQLLGTDCDEIKNRNIREFYVDAKDRDALMEILNRNHGHARFFETRMLNCDGGIVWVSENSHYLYDSEGEISGVEGTIHDITPLKRAEYELSKEKERAQVTLGSIGDGVITTDMNGNIEYMNRVAEQRTGWRTGEAIHKPLTGVLNIVDEKTLQTPPDPVRLCLEEGNSVMLPGYLLLVHRYLNQRLSVEVIASPIRGSSDAITGVVLAFHDVSESRSLAHLSYQATHDSLTGLINRREFERRVNQALDNALQKDVEYALCYLDLDNFKIVNDTCGHAAGDELLMQLTTRIRVKLRKADMFARLGGDEFGMLLPGCPLAKATELAEGFRQLVEDFRFTWDKQSFRVGVSIGMVMIGQDSGSISNVLSAADSACYVAKDQGRNRVHVNDTAVSERHGQMQWVQRIHDVLEMNRFSLYFQPIAKLNRAVDEPYSIHGEVLLRMLDEDDNPIGPGAFIPAAERYNLMPAIDRWVVENTFAALAGRSGRNHVPIDACCINLSGQSLSDSRFMDFLVNQIRDSHVSPGILCFEITETAVIASLNNATRMIALLRDMGCRFALDDFGVGLSSFSYLKNLAVDYLKLDGSFIKNMVHDHIDHEMVRAINQIGHTMDIRTIAEFVENEAILDAVRNIGVDYAQGYAIARPTPIDAVLSGKAIEQGLMNAEKRSITPLLSYPSRRTL